MPAFIDLTGQKFGLLTIIKRAENVKGVQWICKCDCGNTTIVRSYDIKNGKSKSCGCLRHIQYRKSPALKGKTFGRLTVIKRNGSSANKKALWLCRCECGNEITTLGNSLISGRVKSCGCFKKEVNSEMLTKHGFTKGGKLHPLYSVWRNIKKRTANPKNMGYHNYGGRGIKMCSRWRNSFENFIKDMGERPSPKHSIDRINNDGDYAPDNCRWSTKKEQSNNTRKNVTIKINDETKTLTQWCCIYDINYAAALWRFHNGWSIKEIFSIEPFRGRNNRE